MQTQAVPMDNVIAVVLFLVFVVGGLIKNFRETRQSQERANERRLRKQDLPEATRRLYGDESVAPRTATVREATPRGAEGPPPVPLPRTQLEPAAEAARELFETLFGETTVERRPAQSPRPAPQRRDQTTANRPAAGPRPVVVQRREPQSSRPAAPTVVAQRSRMAPIETQEGPSRPAPSPKPKRERATASPVAASVPAQRQRLFDLRLGSKHEVRRAFVLAEVLGQPRAYRPFTGAFDDRR